MIYDCTFLQYPGAQYSFIQLLFPRPSYSTVPYFRRRKNIWCLLLKPKKMLPIQQDRFKYSKGSWKNFLFNPTWLLKSIYEIVMILLRQLMEQFHLIRTLPFCAPLKSIFSPSNVFGKVCLNSAPTQLVTVDSDTFRFVMWVCSNKVGLSFPRPRTPLSKQFVSVSKDYVCFNRSLRAFTFNTQ